MGDCDRGGRACLESSAKLSRAKGLLPPKKCGNNYAMKNKTNINILQSMQQAQLHLGFYYIQVNNAKVQFPEADLSQLYPHTHRYTDTPRDVQADQK